MKTKRRIPQTLLTAAGALLAAVTFSQAQERPPLPYEIEPGPARIGLNSFGAPRPVPEIAAHEVRTPDFSTTIVNPPNGVPRYYVDIRYYACRPWLIHPYTGQPILRHDLLRSVRSTNPEWEALAEGLTMEQLLEPRDDLGGEALVSIEEGGMVDEDNPEALRDFVEMGDAERANAAALEIEIPAGVNHISYAPYYGLYCLRVRLCIPHNPIYAGQVYRYWLRWPYRPHQGWCWSTWWWSSWRQGDRGIGIYPYRPWCTPYTRWVRVGPDWVWNVSNVNRYRSWCLYGLRYYFTNFGTPVAVNPVPYVGQMGLFLQPGGAVPVGWQRAWPYPQWRYWPYKPYCTRWYWFRPVPWFNYRYLPPVVQCAYAIPRNGQGFIPGPVPTDNDDVFPFDPPRVGDDDGLFQHDNAGEFFRNNFITEMATTARPLVRPLGDHDHDGVVTNQDQPRNVRIDERGHAAPIDLHDTDLPPAIGN